MKMQRKNAAEKCSDKMQRQNVMAKSDGMQVNSIKVNGMKLAGYLKRYPAFLYKSGHDRL